VPEPSRTFVRRPIARTEEIADLVGREAQASSGIDNREAVEDLARVPPVF
jgi:hypothetical protein